MEPDLPPQYPKGMNRVYIQRRLLHGDKPILQADITGLGKIILVLGEPGAGKSDLLGEIGCALGTSRISATRFRHITSSMDATKPLIVDALDEVVRLEPEAIDPIIVKASETQAPLVILSSRSSEWDKSRTQLLRECFGVEPAIVRLLPFDEEEQRVLFQSLFPVEDFALFLAEVDRFELRPPLGNPQFLKLFAEAFVQSGRKFTSKRQIFTDAVRGLTIERDDSPKQAGRPPIETIGEAADEIFAKILLSGVSGISVGDNHADPDFPYLNSLSAREHRLLRSLLDTRLFKPSGDPGFHEPVHRIVAEYCAARYLAKRVSHEGDLLTIRRVLALIAPNGVVRDELRGLLGWIAALGSAETQAACITTDPYAVLANGDPSQLARSSKLLLLQKLRKVSESDPHFRRSDSWRSFSVAGFFDDTMIGLVRNELIGKDVVGELRDLLLELMEGSEAVQSLAEDLRSLLIDRGLPRATRIRAQRLLLELPAHDHRRDFRSLVAIGDSKSLRIAAEAALLYPRGTLQSEDILELLRTSGRHAERDRRSSDDHFEHRYYVKNFISQLELDDTVWLLDELTHGLVCTCGAETSYSCKCLIGISRVIGHLLDRYFTASTGDHDPRRLWQWMKSLRFSGHASPEKSTSVEALRSNHALRQAIQSIAFEGAASANDVWDVRMKLSMSHGHSGLHFTYDDLLVHIERAYATDNAALWEGFYSRHNRYSPNRGPDRIRRRMRLQAREKPSLLRIRAREERKAIEVTRKERATWGRSHRKYEKRDEQNRQQTREFFRANADEIRAGRHWWALKLIADRYLIEPEKLSELLDDVSDADVALHNCFDFLKPHVPSLATLVDNSPYALRVLHAACLAHFRKFGDLATIDIPVLQAVRTDLGGYNGYSDGEADRVRAEIDRRIFADAKDIEAFARTYLEPQLMRQPDAATDIGMLRHDKAFVPVRVGLAFEWLERYPAMPQYARDTLFDICAKDGDRGRVIELVSRRCDEAAANECITDEQSATRDFWLLRGLFFLDNPPDAVWDRFRSDPNSIFMIEARAGRFGRSDSESWPDLSAEKIFRILDLFIERWPKVFLPGSFGTHSPPGETAYRFLGEIIWQIGRDQSDEGIVVFDRLLNDERFLDFQDDLKGLRAQALRQRARKAFVPPSPASIVGVLDHQRIATVEDMRALFVEELARLETWFRNSETNPLKTLYKDNGEHVQENDARNRIVERLQNGMVALGLNISIESYMADENRCDITVAAILESVRRMLVVEVKGQWHRELFTAASEQLHVRYSHHPDAAHQGIYLVLWFGPDVSVAGSMSSGIQTATELQVAITERMPDKLRGLIDVVVLDFSRRT